MQITKSNILIYIAAFFRAQAVGLAGTIFGIYLSKNGFNEISIGLVISSGLTGAALSTLFASLFAERLGRRNTLVILALSSVVGGLFISFTCELWAFLFFAFLGMVNGMGKDRHGAYSVEQAIIPQTVEAKSRTAAFSVYNFIMDVGHALGSLYAFLPSLFTNYFRVSEIEAYRFTFLSYSILMGIPILCYFLLPTLIETKKRLERQVISKPTQKRVFGFAALSTIDSLGSGFIAQSFLAIWFFTKFGISPEHLGFLFFAGRIANSISYLVAVWLSHRIGLINTMVFTHIPSSLVLMALPFMDSFLLAAALFVLREFLVQMDVPTRQSYIVSIVNEEERTFASGMSNLARNCAWSITPTFAGAFMGLSKALPLYIGGSLKIIYDVSLWVAFRKVKPVDEMEGR